MQLFPMEENPILEIRAKLGHMTNWSNIHSQTAKVLYKLILETLNLVNASLNEKSSKEKSVKEQLLNGSGKENKFSFIDVPIDINGRHAVCDRARKLFLKLILN